MSKLSFRARALDASKPMPIYMAEELPDLPDYSAINRAVPQMPSGMEKEEECEHHLQRAICAGLIIPTPEVSEIPDSQIHDKLYPANYKQPRQLIHMQPFTMEQDIPDYDMDSDDERWLDSQAKRIELTPLKFEEMMDRLEKSSGQTVVTLNEAKALLKEDDDLIIAVFDYWLNKRLNLQHPLILSVKTEHRVGGALNNPYLAFRRRTEKMQTRKNRKNDETSYEKMLKLRRDLSRAVTLLELVKRREKIKREYVHLTVEVFEKRYQAKDFSGAIMSELSLKSSRPAFTPIFHNHYTNQTWTNKAILKDEIIPRKEKRQYKKRKHKSLSHNRVNLVNGAPLEGLAALSSDEEPLPQPSSEPEEGDDEGQFAFRRNKLCSYHMPKPLGNWPWCSKEENGLADKKYRYTLTSLSNPRRCIGFARRRMGRGGRVILDRLSSELDDYWRTLNFTIYDSQTQTNASPVKSLTKEADVNSFNLNFTSNSSLKTTTKSVVSGYSDNLRTSAGDSFSESSYNRCKQEQPIPVSSYNKCKQETIDTQDEIDAHDVKNHPENSAEMVEILRSVQREWLHFRPKTPPPDYFPPCYMLPAEDPTFVPSANTPFLLELRLADDSTSNNVLADSSTFVTSPFLGEDFTMDLPEVPVTDTRQSSDTTNVQTGINLNVNVGLNTLNPNTNTASNDSFIQSVNLNDGLSLSVDFCNNDNEMVVSSTADDDSDRTFVGCSKFIVTDINGSAGTSSNRYKQMSDSSTLTSPKLNSVNPVSDCKQRSVLDCAAVGNANGLITQFGIDVYPALRTKNNKLQPYAYSGEVGSSNTNSLSLHTSAHTVTLNSHSANIVEIPMSNDSEAVPNKNIAAQCETNTTPANNKNKTIVRKNNLVMEVT